MGSIFSLRAKFISYVTFYFLFFAFWLPWRWQKYQLEQRISMNILPDIELLVIKSKCIFISRDISPKQCHLEKSPMFMWCFFSIPFSWKTRQIVSVHFNLFCKCYLPSAFMEIGKEFSWKHIWSRDKYDNIFCYTFIFKVLQNYK